MVTSSSPWRIVLRHVAIFIDDINPISRISWQRDQGNSVQRRRRIRYIYIYIRDMFMKIQWAATTWDVLYWCTVINPPLCNDIAIKCHYGRESRTAIRSTDSFELNCRGRAFSWCAQEIVRSLRNYVIKSDTPPLLSTVPAVHEMEFKHNR